MAISIKAFDQGLKLLEMNYERELPEPIKNIWFQHLDQHLTDEEFLSAVKHLILNNRFMPTANELVEQAHGTKEVRATEEWQMVIKAAQQWHSMGISERGSEALAYLSDRAKTALQAVGGIHAIAVADSYRLGHLERSFTRVYCQSRKTDARMLPQEQHKSTQKPQEGTETYAPMPEHIKKQMEALNARWSMSD